MVFVRLTGGLCRRYRVSEGINACIIYRDVSTFLQVQFMSLSEVTICFFNNPVRRRGRYRYRVCVKS